MQWSNNWAVQQEVALLAKVSVTFRMLHSLNRRKPKHLMTYLSSQEYFSNEYVNKCFYNADKLWQQVPIFLVKVSQFKNIFTSSTAELLSPSKTTSKFWTRDDNTFLLFLFSFHFLQICLTKVLTKAKSCLAPVWSIHLQITYQRAPMKAHVHTGLWKT